MEEKVIKKLRNEKNKLRGLYKLIMKEVDIESEMMESTELKKLQIISEIDSEITDIIYMILDNKNS